MQKISNFSVASNLCPTFRHVTRSPSSDVIMYYNTQYEHSTAIIYLHL